jgi:hypothetical protein
MARKVYFRHEIGGMPENQTDKMKGRARRRFKKQYSSESERLMAMQRRAQREARWGI